MLLCYCVSQARNVVPACVYVLHAGASFICVGLIKDVSALCVASWGEVLLRDPSLGASVRRGVFPDVVK